VWSHPLFRIGFLKKNIDNYIAPRAPVRKFAMVKVCADKAAVLALAGIGRQPQQLA